MRIQTAPITLERVRHAHGLAAELAANNPILTPVFERIDRELKAMISAPARETRLEMTVRRRKEIRELI